MRCALQFLFYILYISALGDGWSPAVLETEEEYDFVIEGQRELGGEGVSLIGGSPLVVPSDVNEALGYSRYSTKETG